MTELGVKLVGMAGNSEKPILREFTVLATAFLARELSVTSRETPLGIPVVDYRAPLQVYQRALMGDEYFTPEFSLIALADNWFNDYTYCLSSAAKREKRNLLAEIEQLMETAVKPENPAAIEEYSDLLRRLKSKSRKLIPITDLIAAALFQPGILEELDREVMRVIKELKRATK